MQLDFVKKKIYGTSHKLLLTIQTKIYSCVNFFIM